MKKILMAVALAAPVMASVSAMAGEPVELRFSWWGGNDRHTATLEAIEKFQEKHPNIQIRGEYSGWDGYQTRITTQIAGGTEPDLVQLNWNWLDVFSRTGEGFYNLSELENLNLEDYDNGRLATTTRNGKVHAIPTSMSGYSMFFNQTTWDKAGLELPTTWSDLLEAAPVFQEKLGEDFYPMAMGTEALVFSIHSYMIQKHGVSLIDADKRNIAYTDEQLEEFFDIYRQLVENKVVPSSQVLNSYGSGGGIETMRPWITGQWAGNMAPNGDFMASFMEEGQELAVVPHLKREGATESGLHYRPAMVLSVSKNSRYPEEAARFLNFLLHDEDALAILTDNRGLPYSSIANQWLQENDLLDENSMLYQSTKMLDDQTYITEISAYIEEAQLMDIAKDVFQQMDYRNTSAKDAASEYRRRADRVLRRAMRS